MTVEKQIFTMRRLGPGDEAIVTFLATHDGDFDTAERSHALKPLNAAAATAYLSNPTVLHWVAFQGQEIVGFLFCLVLPMRAEDEQELLLYEIGVHTAWRRRGVGRRLLEEMENWMRENAVPEVWLGADNPGAEAFYVACGFVADPTKPVYMTKRLQSRSTL